MKDVAKQLLRYWRKCNMVSIEYKGEFGNNLFQYALARIISEELGYELKTEFPYVGFPNIVSLDGKTIESPKEVLEGHIIDLNGVLSNKEDRNIIVSGYFQRIEYYLDHKDSIKEWFFLPEHKNSFNIGRNDIVLHIRRGNFKKTSAIVDLGFYVGVLDNDSHDRVFVCGRGIDGKTKRVLAKYDPIYVDNGPIEDFKFIKKFNKIVQSTSTFCWWAAFLSDAEEIYVPRSKTGYWGEGTDIDLDINGENYIYINGVTTGLD